MKEFKLSDYAAGDKIYMENLCVKDCQITGIQQSWIEIQNCKFENVIFNNLYEGECLNIENCEFKNCVFGDTFGGFIVKILLFDNKYINCKFDNVSYDGYMDQSEIQDDVFIDCNFKNIEIKGDVNIMGLEFKGGSIKNFNYTGNTISENYFENMLMQDVFAHALVNYNKMENITFENVTIKGVDEYNELINCMNEYKFIKDIN